MSEGKKTILVGIAGGTGSGKTTVAKKICAGFTSREVSLLDQDSYYKDLSHLTLEERMKMNFDHPDALDFELLIHHLKQLADGGSIEKPLYDFTKHSRAEETETIEAKHIIVVEGILIFAVPKLRELFDVKIFVSTDSDERLLRRIERDITERGRDFENIKNQYLNTVKPMYLAFVEPSMRYADVIIPKGGQNKVAINMVVSDIRDRLINNGK